MCVAFCDLLQVWKRVWVLKRKVILEGKTDGKRERGRQMEKEKEEDREDNGEGTYGMFSIFP